MPGVVTVLTDDVEPSRSISIAAATAEPLTSIGRRDVTESLPRIATVDAETSGGSAPAGVAASSASGAQAFRPGSLQVERLIGRGGMGAVYQAVQPSLGRHVAVKRLLRDSVERDDWRTIQFHQEAVISARLAHPNIVPVYDFGVDDEGTPLLSMKLVQGSSWSEALDRDRKAGTYEELLGTHIPILMQVAQAVAFAHSRGIVYRDLKPSQVMLGEFGEVLLMDWGLALSVADGEEAASKTTLRAPTPVPLPDRSTGSSPCGTPA